LARDSVFEREGFATPLKGLDALLAQLVAPSSGKIRH